MYLTLDQALLQEPEYIAFVVFEGRTIGRKLGNELFLEFDIDLELAKQLKEVIKTYKPIVLPDDKRPGRVMLLTKSGQLIRFNYDLIYYEGIVKPVFFSKLYTSDALDIRPASLLALYDVDTAQKKYLEVITSSLNL